MLHQDIIQELRCPSCHVAFVSAPKLLAHSCSNAHNVQKLELFQSLRDRAEARYVIDTTGATNTVRAHSRKRRRVSKADTASKPTKSRHITCDTHNIHPIGHADQPAAHRYPRLIPDPSAQNVPESLAGTPEVLREAPIRSGAASYFAESLADTAGTGPDINPSAGGIYGLFNPVTNFNNAQPTDTSLYDFFHTEFHARNLAGL
ncbi:hypothetical protein PG989_001108 [Apiospora arundinis]